MLASKLLSAIGSNEEPLYSDSVFCTYLYTGNGSIQTINNGIDLAGKGGLVWLKRRDGVLDNILIDTSRGAAFTLSSNRTDQQYNAVGPYFEFTNTGYNFKVGGTTLNESGFNNASWTFRKAPKFFDVVTWTGTGALRAVTHALGAVPGMILIKALSVSSDWLVWHRGMSSPNNTYMRLNTIGAEAAGSMVYGVNSTVFSLQDQSGTGAPSINQSGVTYVAYLFAHDPSADGIIQCGSYTGNGSATGPIVNLGWEPQYLMIKNAYGTGNWQIIDSMRGMPVGSADATLQANLANAESSVDYVSPTAAGFQVTSSSSEVNTSGSNYIYLAIRRPNKPPKTGAEVYKGITRVGLNASAGVITGIGFSPDLLLTKCRDYSTDNGVFTRVLGNSKGLITNSTIPEFGSASLSRLDFDMSNSVRVGADQYGLMNGAYTYIHNFFRRAPGFFDVVCYTGTGVARTVPHNLGVVPELMIVKGRNTSGYAWVVYGPGSIGSKNLVLNGVNSAYNESYLFPSPPTSGVVNLSGQTEVNASGYLYIGYLFASLPGISKVGSYTGNGGTQTIDCGFTTGARFILIKRTDNTGDWYVWDTARGIVAANDPHLSLNSTAAEVTTDDSVDPHASGFTVNQVAATNINVSGGQYIFLSIA